MAFNLGDALKGVSDFGTGREQIEYIRLDLIDNDPNNFYQLSDIDELAANIELCGLQQPIRLRPNPDNPERYMIVSGHRRRAAIELLEKDNPEKWSEAPCIVERDAVSPTLRQLRLIYANANTRKMTPAETSEQAVQVEKLLYQLKEEGYEFPGRMRDHVAEAVGASKSKLARLKVIRDKLDDCWKPYFESNRIVEQTAYLLAQLPKHEQIFVHVYMQSTKGAPDAVSASVVEAYKDRIDAMSGLVCPTEGVPCQNMDNKRNATIRTGIYDFHACGKCCATCYKLTTCRYACSKLADLIAKQKADTVAKRRAEQAADAKRNAPTIEWISNIWLRFRELRETSGVSIEKASQTVGSGLTTKQYLDYERGKNISANTSLPFGTVFKFDVDRTIALADLLGCSIDYLFCRTDIKEMATEAVPESDREAKEPEFIPGAWYPATVEPPVGVPLVLIDAEGYTDDGKYTGCGEFATYCLDAPVSLWTLKPSEKDASAAPAPTGWRSGTPEAYGTYTAYVKVVGAANPMLRELLWDGEEWFLFGNKIDENVTVHCWTERPDL